MPIQLTDELKTAINSAMADSAPLIIATVDPNGQPAMSFRGSTQTVSDNELGIWIRNQDGGLLRSIANNPRIAIMYRNPQTRISFQMHGEARRADDEETRNRVYEAAPEVERNADAERKGTAIIIDLVRVIQRGQVIMER